MNPTTAARSANASSLVLADLEDLIATINRTQASFDSQTDRDAPKANEQFLSTVGSSLAEIVGNVRRATGLLAEISAPPASAPLGIESSTVASAAVVVRARWAEP